MGEGTVVMQFDSFSDLLTMSGHGLYVWLAYGVFLLTLLVLVIQPGIKRASVAKAIRQRAKFEVEADDYASR